jgi:hypothetical protein
LRDGGFNPNVDFMPGAPPLRGGRAIRSNKNADPGKSGVWGFAPNSGSQSQRDWLKNQAFLFRSYPLRVSAV